MGMSSRIAMSSAIRTNHFYIASNIIRDIRIDFTKEAIIPFYRIRTSTNMLRVLTLAKAVTVNEGLLFYPLRQCSPFHYFQFSKIKKECQPKQGRTYLRLFWNLSPCPPSLSKGRGSVSKRGALPLSKSLPPLLAQGESPQETFKERGIKGVRLINNLYI